MTLTLFFFYHFRSTCPNAPLLGVPKQARESQRLPGAHAHPCGALGQEFAGTPCRTVRHARSLAVVEHSKKQKGNGARTTTRVGHATSVHEAPTPRAKGGTRRYAGKVRPTPIRTTATNSKGERAPEGHRQNHLQKRPPLSPCTV